jgi:hypothetical protein
MSAAPVDWGESVDVESAFPNVVEGSFAVPDVTDASVAVAVVSPVWVALKEVDVLLGKALASALLQRISLRFINEVKQTPRGEKKKIKTKVSTLSYMYIYRIGISRRIREGKAYLHR